MTTSIRYQGRPTQVPTKDPNAVIRYGIDWSDYLGTEQILSSGWIAEGAIVIESDSHDTTSTSVLLSGGTSGTRYKVTNRITYTGTGGNETDDRTIIVPVREL